MKIKLILRTDAGACAALGGWFVAASMEEKLPLLGSVPSNVSGLIIGTTFGGPPPVGMPKSDVGWAIGGFAC